MSDSENETKLAFEDDQSNGPKLSKAKATKLRKKAAKKIKVKSERGYMYIGHLPHGFYENEIRSYFSQFGRIMKLRLARSVKTGNHKGYGFIEFESKHVAEIAAETMNNYLMFNKILKCHVVPTEKLHKFTFRNAKKPLYIKIKSRFRRMFNAKKSEKSLEKFKAKQEKNLKKKETLLKEYGISLDLSNMLKKEEKKDTVLPKTEEISEKKEISEKSPITEKKEEPSHDKPKKKLKSKK